MMRPKTRQPAPASSRSATKDDWVTGSESLYEMVGYRESWIRAVSQQIRAWSSCPQAGSPGSPSPNVNITSSRSLKGGPKIDPLRVL